MFLHVSHSKRKSKFMYHLHLISLYPLKQIKYNLYTTFIYLGILAILFLLHPFLNYSINWNIYPSLVSSGSGTQYFYHMYPLHFNELDNHQSSFKWRASLSSSSKIIRWLFASKNFSFILISLSN